MAKLIQSFNARNFNPEQGVGGFPIGNFLVKNVSSEVKATKAGDGGYLMFTAQIIDGEHAGTTGAIRLNLYSASPDAARIAHSQFSAMCHVCNVMDVQDSGQLHEIPYRIEVGLQKEPNPNKYTEVKRFFDVNGNAPGGNGGGQQQTQGTQQGGGQQGGGSWGQQGNGQQQGAQQQGNGGSWGNQGGGQPDNGGQQQGGQQGTQQGGGSWGNAGAQQGQQGQQQGNGSWGNGAQGGGNGGSWGQQGGGNGGQWGNRQ